MITGGLDLGTGTAKGVLLEDGRTIVASAIETTRGSPVEAGRRVLERMAEEASVLPDGLDYLCTTGAARYVYPDRQLQVSDITAAGRGAVFLFPGTRHVLDIGAQSSRALSVTETGRVVRFKMNEKCAAGAGRFVDRCAKYLQVPLDELASKALAADHPKPISSVCAVLAETEIINNVAEGIPLPDILMGVFLSLAQRANTLMRIVGVQPEVTLVGGLVHNEAMVRALEQTVQTHINRDPKGQYAAALGAAMLGHARLRKLNPAAAGSPAVGG
jgi:predicted CoA-substrate-specific enzyme activase